MRASTLFVVTFVLWLTAKGRAPAYWKLATTSDVTPVPSSGSSGASGGGNSSPLPDLQAYGQTMLKMFGGS